MTDPSSTTAKKVENSIGLIRVLIILAASTIIILVLWALTASQADPYIQTTLSLKGSAERGSRLFRINCAGCHGISAQGLVGPNLREVNKKLNDKQIINQIVKGKTPPMPSFELEPQAMADLIEHLHNIN